MPGTSCERALPPCQKLPSPGTEIVKIYSSNSSSGRLALCYYNIIFILQFIMFFCNPSIKNLGKIAIFPLFSRLGDVKKYFHLEKTEKKLNFKKIVFRGSKSSFLPEYTPLRWGGFLCWSRDPVKCLNLNPQFLLCRWRRASWTMQCGVSPPLLKYSMKIISVWTIRIFSRPLQLLLL